MSFAEGNLKFKGHFEQQLSNFLIYKICEIINK